MPKKRALNELVANLSTLSGWLLLLPFLGLIPQFSLPILYGIVLSNPLVLFLLWEGHSYPKSQYDYFYWAGKVAVFSVYVILAFRFFLPEHTALLSLRMRGLFMNPVLHGLITAALALNPKWLKDLLPHSFWKPFGTPPKVDLTPGDFLVSGLAYAALGAFHLWASIEAAKVGRLTGIAVESSQKDGDKRTPETAPKEPPLAAGGGDLTKEVVSGKSPTPFLPPGPKPQVVDRKRRLEILKRALEGAELEEGLDLERVVKISAHLSEAALDERVRLARFKAEAMGKPVTWELLKRTLKKE